MEICENRDTNRGKSLTQKVLRTQEDGVTEEVKVIGDEVRGKQVHLLCRTLV